MSEKVYCDTCDDIFRVTTSDMEEKNIKYDNVIEYWKKIYHNFNPMFKGRYITNICDPDSCIIFDGKFFGFDIEIQKEYIATILIYNKNHEKYDEQKYNYEKLCANCIYELFEDNILIIDNIAYEDPYQHNDDYNLCIVYILNDEKYYSRFSINFIEKIIEDNYETNNITGENMIKLQEILYDFYGPV